MDGWMDGEREGWREKWMGGWSGSEDKRTCMNENQWIDRWRRETVVSFKDDVSIGFFSDGSTTYNKSINAVIVIFGILIILIQQQGLL